MVSNWLKTSPEVSERNILKFGCGEALQEYPRRFALGIVFLDCKMEGIDGIETAKAIRRHDSRLVIVLLTDFITEEKLAQAGYYDLPAQYEHLGKLHLCG